MRCPPGRWRRRRCSRSPSPPGPPVSCAPGCARSVPSGVQARTFHAAALRQLSYFAPQILGGPMPDVANNPIRWVSLAASRQRLRPDKTELRDLASEIDWAKSSLIKPADYVAAAVRANRGISVTPGRVAEVYAGYEEVKRANNEIDFADLLLVMAGALEEIPQIARTIRAQYRYFVIDEYQDVSPIQQRLLDAWLGGRDELCVVGDANQTIYSFAGAQPSYLLDFQRALPTGRGHPAGTGLPLHPADRRAGQPVDRRRRGRPARAPEAGRAAAGRTAADLRRARRRGGRGHGGGRQHQTADGRGHPGGGDRGAVPDQRPVPGL